MNQCLSIVSVFTNDIYVVGYSSLGETDYNV